MSATDELRRLLDERGVEWMPYSAFSTLYTTPDGKPVRADGDFMEGRVELYVRNLTPEQAVEATLGSDLQAENSELRKHVRMPDEPLEIDEKDFYVRAFIKWAIEEQPEVKRLEAENAELRELVRGLWYCTENENKAMCEGCPLGTVEGDRLALACEKLMCELGVDA